jgi:hypothetical protein
MKNNFFRKFIFFLLFFLILLFPKLANAQELRGETLEGRVIEISESGEKMLAIGVFRTSLEF